jgi:hypothetical protein
VDEDAEDDSHGMGRWLMKPEVCMKGNPDKTRHVFVFATHKSTIHAVVESL